MMTVSKNGVPTKSLKKPGDEVTLTGNPMLACNEKSCSISFGEFKVLQSTTNYIEIRKDALGKDGFAFSSDGKNIHAFLKSGIKCAMHEDQRPGKHMTGMVCGDKKFFDSKSWEPTRKE